MAKKDKKAKRQQDSGNTLLGPILLAGGIGALIGLLVFGRRLNNGASGIAGAIDRALGLPSEAEGDGGSSAADLGLDQAHHGPDDRANEDFRPDPTAAVPADRREAFAPATMPNPNAAQPAA